MASWRALLLAVAAGLILGAPAVARAQASFSDLEISVPPFAPGAARRAALAPKFALAAQSPAPVPQGQGRWSTTQTLATGALIGAGIGVLTGGAAGLASGEPGAALYGAALFAMTNAPNGVAIAVVSRHVYRRARPATPLGGARWKAVLVGAGTGAALGVLTGIIADRSSQAIVADTDYRVTGTLFGVLGGVTGTVVAAAIAHR